MAAAAEMILEQDRMECESGEEEEEEEEEDEEEEEVREYSLTDSGYGGSDEQK